MASKTDEDIEKEYTELRLRYALENHEIRQLFQEWIKKQEESTKFLWDKFTPEISKSEFDAGHEIVKNAKNAYETLYTRLIDFGIIYYRLKDVYNDYCRIIGREKLKYMDRHKSFEYGVRLSSESRILKFKTHENTRKLMEIIKNLQSDENDRENDEQWLVDNYDDLELLEELGERHDITFGQILYLHKSANIALPSYKMKKFYLLLKERWVDDDQVEGPCLEEIDFLKDGRYLNLTIDLFKSTELIQEEIKEIIKIFKRMMGKITPSTKRRRQDIELYKQYLRVYKLVQEKGEGKWTEIAKEVFPEDFISEDEQLESDSHNIPNPESAIAKVHNYYKEAKRLIAEGLP